MPLTRIWDVILVAGSCGSLYIFINYIFRVITFIEVGNVLLLGVYTSIRVLVLILIGSIIWVPIGVWIGRRPNIAMVAQPIIQFLASFPAYLLFPLVITIIIKYSLNVEIWSSPLMMLGSQWYILFNIIAGTMALPKDLHYATNLMGLSGFKWWKRFMLPGIFPYYVTGAITAAGGAWNASIVAEWVEWGDTTLVASGLGSYIAENTLTGEFERIALGTGVMCIFVLLLNKICWLPLYRLAQSRMQ